MGIHLFESYAYIDAKGYNDDDYMSMVSFYDDKVLIIDTFSQSVIKTMSYDEFVKKYPCITMYDVDRNSD